MSRRSFDATCAVPVAAVRAQPEDGAEQVTQLLRGEPVSPRERRDGWVHVLTAYDYAGWVREDALAGDALAEARGFLGSPYEWGGMTERGIDCSGLVHMAYRRAGRLVPRDADQQEEAGRALSEGELHPGDLVTYGGDRADHIAFWLGDGRVLHASGRAGGVVEEAEPEQLRGRRRRLVRF